MNKLTKPLAVLVTTKYQGVFFGYTTDPYADPICLTKARNTIYWSKETGGFLGLASDGPGEGSRIGATVEKLNSLVGITSVVEVSKSAEKSWLSWPVHRGG